MRNGFRKRCQLSVAISGLIAASACSTVDLGDAAKLAQAGQTASASFAQFYSQARTELPAVLEIEVLRSTLQPGISPPSPQMIADIERSRASLAVRERLGRDLTQLYDSFHELASTDYPGGFRTAAENLNGSIGAFATSVGVQSPITDAHVNLVGSFFSSLIRERQRRRVRIANRIVLQQLELLQPLLVRDRQVVTSLRQRTRDQFEEAGIALWRAGNVSAKPLLARYSQSAGLELVGEESAYTYANERLREAVPALIRFRLNQIDAVEASRYQAMEDTVATLIRRHREIDAGAPMNLATLLERVAELQALRSEIEAAFR